VRRALLLLALGTVSIATVACDADPHLPSPMAGFGLTSEACGACHQRHLEEWRDAPHAHSASSPVFLGLVEAARQAWGDAAADQCVACHAPQHEGAGAAPPRIGCVSCHAATGNRGTRDGLLVVRADLPMAGPGHGDPAPHPTRPGGLLASPVLCGTCHEVTGPGHFVEPTYSEHLASPAAAAGLTCQTCHMRRGADGHTDHRMAGVDPPWHLPSGEAAAARRAMAEELLGAALRLELEAWGDGAVLVRLANVGAGHAVPTGATLLREIWVDLAAGETIHPRVVELGAELTRAGEPVGLPTEADLVIHRTLLPGGAAEVVVPVAPEAGVVATLRARAVRPALMLALGLDPASVPVLEVAQTSLAAP